MAYTGDLLMSAKNLTRAIILIEKAGVEVSYMGRTSEIPEDIGNTLPYNGCAYLDENMIDLYADNPDDDTNQILCVLIHEYGHILAYKKYGDAHTEKMAWDFGVAAFPKSMIPKCLPTIRDICLYSYAENGVY